MMVIEKDVRDGLLPLTLELMPEDRHRELMECRGFLNSPEASF